MTTYRPLTTVLASLFITFAGACTPEAPPISMSFMDVGAAGVAPMFVKGQCLDRTPPLVSDGVACAVVEARHADGACGCDESAARLPIAAAHEGILSTIQETEQSHAEAWNCFCEIAQLDGAQAEACQTDPSNDVEVLGEPVDGFCYVDATTSPALGNPALTAQCPEAQQRFVRFVGQATQGSPGTKTTRITACDVTAQ